MPEGWRKMWVMVFYDLPVATADDRRRATKFHQFVIEQGFERMHFSVYNRYCGSMERALTFERRIERALPRKGYVCLLKLTDRQMTTMRHWITGGYRPDEGADIAPPAQYQMF